jgi:hypothetical protein
MVKALSLFSSLKENKFKGDTTVFSASRGWFEMFEAGTGMRNVKLTVCRTLDNGINCYPEMYEEKKKLQLFKRRLTNIFLESSISIFSPVL